jgi:hypothetical protein
MFKSCAVLIGLLSLGWALIALLVWVVYYFGGLLNDLLDGVL